MRINNIGVFVEDSYDALSLKAAQIIKAQVNAKPKSVLGLATGSTPIGTYNKLVKMHKSGEVDFSQVTTFNLDEYYPIKKSNDQSYDYFIRENLFSKINIPNENINIPNGEANDFKAECEAYEQKIISSGGIDLQILGIGNNGHIGFNEPGDFFVAATHHVELDDATIQANSRFFDSPDDVPKHALTIGMRTIITAKKIIMVANGGHKAEAIYQAVHGAITPQNPASILQLHPNVILVLDKEAGAKLI